MFENLPMAPPDAILGLAEAFKQDSNPQKINLSVGVYQDAGGNTPVLQCVKQAEMRLLETEITKSYLGIAGLPDFARHVQQLLVDGGELNNRAVTVQTPGGTGALRIAADFIRSNLPIRRIWVSNPTWANHPSVFEAAGLEVAAYSYLDKAGTGLDAEALLASLQSIPEGEAICLHACCHNPTGIDPTVELWQEIARVVSQRKLLPLIDFAYQGFGDGVREDATSLEILLQCCPELLICSSFSKNFGLYGERTGALTVVGDQLESAVLALSQIKRCIRANYSNPPKHGAAIVATVLEDEELTELWHREVAKMRDRIHSMRQLFVRTMEAKRAGRDFSFLNNQRGMFSFTGLTPLQVDQLRTEHSIYIVGSGRVNVAGMTADNMDRLCDAVKSVL